MSLFIINLKFCHLYVDKIVFAELQGYFSLHEKLPQCSTPLRCETLGLFFISCKRECGWDVFFGSCYVFYFLFLFSRKCAPTYVIRHISELKYAPAHGIFRFFWKLANRRCLFTSDLRLFKPNTARDEGISANSQTQHWRTTNIWLAVASLRTLFLYRIAE